MLNTQKPNNPEAVSEMRLKYLMEAREFLWKEGYHYCTCGGKPWREAQVAGETRGYWKKKPHVLFICECERD